MNILLCIVRMRITFNISLSFNAVYEIYLCCIDNVLLHLE